MPSPTMKSRFSRTCSLLSQYIKEKGALGIDITPRAPGADSPRIALPDLNAGVATRPADQMTIFYGGEVIVFDNLPVEKARELVAMAAKGAAAPCSAFEICALGQIGFAARVPEVNETVSADLPIARRVSLNRFLEKRKDRISSKAPYPMPNSPPSSSPAWPPPPPRSAEEREGWFGLAPSSSKQ